MLTNLLLLAQDALNDAAPGSPPAAPPPSDSFLRLEWYSWIGIIGIPVILILYKIYKNKTMS